MSVYKKLSQIQQELVVGKTNDNKFAGFKYRTCSDILTSVKPLLAQTQTTLMITDDLEVGNDRIYIKSTVTFIDTETGETITASALAREAEKKTKMDAAQITGSSSSYARKYALCGLFCIDDTTDIDSLDSTQNSQIQPQQQNPQIIPAHTPQKAICQNCNCEIVSTQIDGKTYDTASIVRISMKKYNAPICSICMKILSTTTTTGGNQ